MTVNKTIAALDLKVGDHLVYDTVTDIAHVFSHSGPAKAALRALKGPGLVLAVVEVNDSIT